MENSFPYIRRKSYSSGTFNRFTFQNPKEVRNPRELMMGLYWIASDMQKMWYCSILLWFVWKRRIIRYLAVCELSDVYLQCQCSRQSGSSPESAKSLLKNIIESADRAIREGTPATLRFGHDTNLIRLLALMQVEGCSNQETDPDRYYLAWQDFRVSPMGANLQLIFSRISYCKIAT